MPLLTIAIPTYNRAEILKQKLSFLFSTIDENCLILISDNASEDNTTDIVKPFMEQFSNIAYHRNTTNLGYDANVLKCVELSTTDYVWILSDDDDIEQNAPYIILNYIKQESPDLICLNDTNEKGILTFTSLRTLTGEKIQIDVGNILSLSNLAEEERYAYIASFFWVSRLVINKTKIKNFASLQEYIGSSFIQLALTNTLLLNKISTILYTKEGLITNNPHCVFSHNFVDVFVNKFYDFCMIPYSAFSEKTALKVASQNIPFIVDGLKQHKIGNKIFNYDYRFFYLIGKMFKYRCSLSLIFKFITIFAIPTPVMKFFKKAKHPCKEDENKRTFI